MWMRFEATRPKPKPYKKAPEFHCFPRLPYEIQRLILSFHFSSPRVAVVDIIPPEKSLRISPQVQEIEKLIVDINSETVRQDIYDIGEQLGCSQFEMAPRYLRTLRLRRNMDFLHLNWERPRCLMLNSRRLDRAPLEDVFRAAKDHNLKLSISSKLFLDFLAPNCTARAMPTLRHVQRMKALIQSQLKTLHVVLGTVHMHLASEEALQSGLFDHAHDTKLVNAYDKNTIWAFCKVWALYAEGEDDGTKSMFEFFLNQSYLAERINVWLKSANELMLWAAKPAQAFQLPPADGNMMHPKPASPFRHYAEQYSKPKFRYGRRRRTIDTPKSAEEKAMELPELVPMIMFVHCSRECPHNTSMPSQTYSTGFQRIESLPQPSPFPYPRLTERSDDYMFRSTSSPMRMLGNINPIWYPRIDFNNEVPIRTFVLPHYPEHFNPEDGPTPASNDPRPEQLESIFSGDLSPFSATTLRPSASGSRPMGPTQ